MLEREIEKAVCDYARSLGMVCYKFTSPNHLGVPDRLFFAPAGKVFLIEFKREGGKPTPSQEREAARINMMGTTVYLVDNVKEGKEIIDGEWAESQGAAQFIAMLRGENNAPRH